MEDLIKSITSNPAMLLGAAALALLLALTVLTKLFKLMALVLILIIAYAGWLVYTGGQPPNNVKKAIEGVTKTGVESIKEAAGEALDEAGDMVKETVKEKVKQELD
jgi:hypothetical protein